MACAGGHIWIEGSNVDEMAGVGNWRLESAV